MTTSQSLKQDIAAALLKIEAITLRPQEPFTWSSGLKSPIYCDNRLTMSYPQVREQIASGFADRISELYPDVQLIAGTATAGIPHAAWVADKLKLPMIYVRDKAKGHGKQNMIEGRILKDQKTVVIEDLISTGGSSLKAAKAVREAGGDVQGVMAIFTYEFEQAAQAFASAQLPLHTLSDYTTLIQLAREENRISDAELELLMQWKASPQAFGK